MNQHQIIPNISVDCVVFGYDGLHLKVLLIQQKKTEPTVKPQFALPGDLVRLDEDLDEAANRVLQELTQLKGIYLKQFKAFGNPERVKAKKDSDWLRAIREFPQERVVTIAYYSLVNIADVQPKASAFAEQTAWVKLREVPPLAFDHKAILHEALKKFRTELVNHNLGFELLPKKFTLGQLQNLYELVLEKKLDKRNFRKSVKRLEHLQPLDEKEQGVDHKPAQLYRFMPEN